MRDGRLRLEDIRDASSGLSEDFRRNHPEEIWSDAINFRNVLVHQYFGIDYEAVWAVVDRDLPATPGVRVCPRHRITMSTTTRTESRPPGRVQSRSKGTNVYLLLPRTKRDIVVKVSEIVR